MHEDVQAEMKTVATPQRIADAMSTFTCQEWVALLGLRRRYREGQDLWSSRELANLRFLRWLRTTYRLES